jgi:hypothetical protein
MGKAIRAGRGGSGAREHLIAERPFDRVARQEPQLSCSRSAATRWVTLGAPAR